MGFPGLVGKNAPANVGEWVLSLGREDPLEKEVKLTPVSLPEKAHGQRSLVGYSPWCGKIIRYDLATKQQQGTESK